MRSVMQTMVVVMLVSCLHAASAYQLQLGSTVRAPSMRAMRAHAPLACTQSGKSLAEIASEKRKRAEELAAKAAKADLEAEVLELQAKELSLSTALKRAEKEAEEEAMKPAESSAAAATTAAPPVVVESVPQTSSADASSATTTTTTTSDAAKTDQSPVASAFNMSALLDPDALPPPPPMSFGAVAYAVERSGKSESELQLTEAQVETCKERIFDIDSYYVTKVEQTFLGTIFRGNLRGNASHASELVAQNAEKQRSLDGYTFVLLDDPIALTLQDMEAGNERRPVFLALPTAATRISQGVPEYVAAVLGLFASVITTLGFALSTYLLADGGAMLVQLEAGDTTPRHRRPIAIGVGLLQLLHELGHLAAAKSNLKMGMPTVVPSLQLGLFGCVTRLLEFPKSRQALFEFALAGPSPPAPSPSSSSHRRRTFCGTAHPVIPEIDISAIEPTATPRLCRSRRRRRRRRQGLRAELMPVVPSSLIQTSLLLGTIATAALPAMSSEAVALHPLAVVGFVGTLVMPRAAPIGRLDGGRVAVLGQSNASLLSGVPPPHRTLDTHRRRESVYSSLASTSSSSSEGAASKDDITESTTMTSSSPPSPPPPCSSSSTLPRHLGGRGRRVQRRVGLLLALLARSPPLLTYCVLRVAHLGRMRPTENQRRSSWRALRDHGACRADGECAVRACGWT